MYKGQRRIQNEFMTQAYQTFIVKENNFQIYIPTIATIKSTKQFIVNYRCHYQCRERAFQNIKGYHRTVIDPGFH